MKQYLDLIRKVLKDGTKKTNRTGINTISYFGYQMRFDLSDGFPLLTTKKVHFHSILVELLWFLSGSTNIKYLVDNNVRIWNEWPYEVYKNSKDYKGETIKEFAAKIKEDANFAKKHGNLGPVYGKQWRDFNGVDQISELIKNIKENPDSRRLIVSAWNPSEIKDMVLPPCHILMQFNVVGDKLNLQLYQRSADIFLGVPFNIASYALLLILIAHVTNLKPGEFVHTLGDAHIYENHLDLVNLQLSRKTRKLPTITLNENIKDIFKFKIEDITLNDYDPHPLIKGVVAV